jgi:Spy/CpxP family protein refolding chaperone
MLKPHKMLCGIVIVVLVFLCSSTAMAASQNLPRGKWWSNPQISEQLKLSDEEKLQLDEILLQSHRNLGELKNKVKKEQLELEVLMGKKASDETAIMKQFNKLEAARTDLAAEQFGFVLGVRNILGFERFDQLKTLFRSHKKKPAPKSDKKKPKKELSDTDPKTVQ